MWRIAFVGAALVAGCGQDEAGERPDDGGADGGADAGGEPGGITARPGDIGLVVFVRPDVRVEPAYAYLTSIGDGVQPPVPLPAPDADDGARDYSVQWSPDAALSYYSHEDFDGKSYWLDPRDWSDGPLAVAETGQRLLWSLDGTGFVSGRAAGDDAEILVTPMVNGRPGEPIAIATIDYHSFKGRTAWSPDGMMVLFVAFPPIGVSPTMQVVSRDGEGWSTPIDVPADQPAYDEVTWPNWSPDSRSILYEFLHYTPQGDAHTLELVEIAAPDVRHVLAADPCVSTNPGYSSWAPDGSRVVFWVKEATGCRAHVARRAATGWTSRPLNDGLRTYPEPNIVWSRDSRHILRRSSNLEDLLWSDVSAPSTEALVVTPAAPAGSIVTEYKLAPDHSKLAILRVDGSGPSGTDERRDLYLADMSSGAPGELVKVTTVGSGAVGGQITWAPDSSRLSVEGREDSAIIEIATGAITPYGSRRFDGWSPDSRWIALSEFLSPLPRIELTVRRVTDDGLEPPLVVAPPDLPVAGSVIGARWAPKPY